MFARMIVPSFVVLALVLGGLAYGPYQSMARHGARAEPAPTGRAEASTTVAAIARTDHFAASARRIRAHPALGPFSPEEIRRRTARLIEGPRLAVPPPSVLVALEARASEVPSISTAQSRAEPARTLPASASPGPSPEGQARQGPRNVVIPMVVSSADGRIWRAHDGTGTGGTARKNAHCRAEALAELKHYSASGYRIYDKLNDKRMFTTWILCDERQRGLTTAVHEGVHMLTEQLDAYPLVDGGQIARISITEKLAKPGRIAGQFSRSDDFVRTYLLPGGASSADDFTYLLDEFNAYIHDLNTAVQTRELAPRDRYLGHRDGMAAMMSFVMAYVAMAEKEDARTWAGLHRPDVKHLVSTLWSDAERTIEKSCHVPRYAVDDQAFLRHICAPGNGRALGHLLGRAPRCPSACLGPASG